MCPIRHCLDRSVSINSFNSWFVFVKQKLMGSSFGGKLCLFVRVAQTVNCGIYWVFLNVCRNAIRPISPAILCNILITLHVHSPCHISLALQQFMVMTQTVAVPNCMWLRSLTETQQLTQFFCLQYVKFNRKQQQVQQPSQIGLTEVLQPYSCSKCVCVMCVCVWLAWFCIYEAVYRLCPNYRKSFIPHAFLCKR